MSTNATSTSAPPEAFLVDSDCDPQLVLLFRALGFRARNVLNVQLPNDDTLLWAWARNHGYILVCHDKHRDAESRFSFFSEMYYRGGQVIRIGGQPGQDPIWALGKVLAHRPTWQQYFAADSGEVVVHSSGCNFKSAEELFRRSRYIMRIPFEDPAVPVRNRAPIERNRPSKPKLPRASERLVEEEPKGS